MSDPTTPLERRARARLADRERPDRDEQLTASELRGVVHELHVHQLELELQNEEIQRAQHRVEESRAALAVSEQRYRELFEAAPVGYLSLDRGGAILEANRTLRELLCAGAVDLTGRKLTDFIAPQYQDAYYFHFQAAIRGELPAPTRVVLLPLSGAARDVEMGARPSAAGPDQIGVAILDVSARERAEAEHHESERQRRLMADALPIAVSYVRADGRYEFCNRAFHALHGVSADPVEGRALFEVLGESTYAAWRDHVRAALTGQAARFEGELSLGAGRRFVSALFAPDRAPDGRIHGFYALVDDRTDLEQARRGLREAAAQVALAEERERRTLATGLHDHAGQLLSLASIKLSALQEQVGDSAWAGTLREVADLLREGRESIASLSFELSPPLLYDLGFLAAAEWLAENLRDRYGLAAEIVHTGDVPELDEAARVTLFRSLRETLINVAKHAGTKRATVAVRGGPEGVTVAVEDHGFGFDPQAPMEGFGLGSVLERIESLGGRVVIDSAPGRGTRISIHVPAGEGRPS